MINSFIIEYWKKYGSQQPICDIGCGESIIFSFDYTRFDKAQTVSIVWGMKSSANVFGDFHNMNMFPDNHFGFIVSKDSFEHAEFPLQAIREWIRILRVGGHLLLLIPGKEFKVSEDVKSKFPKWNKLISEGKLAEYENDGGIRSWISRSPSGELFLDVHYNDLVSPQEIGGILPGNATIVESMFREEYGGGMFVIQKNKSRTKDEGYYARRQRGEE